MTDNNECYPTIQDWLRQINVAKRNPRFCLTINQNHFEDEIVELLSTRTPPISYDAAVEKVARAIYFESENPSIEYDGQENEIYESEGFNGKSGYHELAKAALAAIGIVEGK